MTVSAGDQAPGFTLIDDTGAEVSLADFAGKGLILYFYPKAFTGGCTKQACDFRDLYGDYRKAGYEIAGVSPDAPERLAEFRSEYGLPFRLLSDEDHAVAEAYGAWGTKKNYGKEYQGLIRSTFEIGPDGKIVNAWRNVRATGNAARTLEQTG